MQSYMVSIQLHTYMALIVYVHIVYLAYYLKTGSVELGQGILIPRVTKKKEASPNLCKKRGGSGTLAETLVNCITVRYVIIMNKKS